MNAASSTSRHRGGSGRERADRRRGRAGAQCRRARQALVAEDASAPPAPGRNLVVASLNMHCLKNEGTSFASSAARAAAVAKKMKALGVDVLVAQEVCTRAGQGGESMEGHLGAALRTETGATWESRLVYVHDAWVGTPDEAREHLGIFSRLPLGEARPLVHRVQWALSRQALAVRVSPPGMPPVDPTIPVHGPFSADFKWVTLPGEEGRPICCTDGQAAVFRALWSFKGEPRSSEQVMGRAQLSSQKPIDVFKGKKYAEPLRAYQALVTTQQRAGLYSMACAAAPSLATA